MFKGKKYLELKEELTEVMRETVKEEFHKSISINEKVFSGNLNYKTWHDTLRFTQS